jgi:APA family basic amino acid/polyamine antiporter
VVTTIVKLAVLAFMPAVGLFFISSANSTPWNVSKESAINAIGGGMAIALFSYLGVETVAVAVAKVGVLAARTKREALGAPARLTTQDDVR